MSQGSAGATGNLVSGQYNVSPPTYTDGQQTTIQTDANGRVLTATGSGGTDNVNLTELGGAAVTANVTLLSNASATGSPQAVGPGTYILDAVGTWGGATLTLQYLAADGVTYVTVPNVSLTANGPVEVDVGAASMIKAVLTGGSPTGIYAKLSIVL